MKFAVTVLYEDAIAKDAGSKYPLHDLVLSMVEDDSGVQLWQLDRAVDKNPRNGVSKLLGDLARTDRLAGAGRLFVLVDRDRVAEALHLPRDASDDAVCATIRGRSDAPDKLDVFFLHPNLEGLLVAVRACDPALLPDQVTRALEKKLLDRDLVLAEARKPHRRALRECVRRHQPGLHALVQAISTRVSP